MHMMQVGERAVRWGRKLTDPIRSGALLLWFRLVIPASEDESKWSTLLTQAERVSERRASHHRGAAGQFSLAPVIHTQGARGYLCTLRRPLLFLSSF